MFSSGAEANSSKGLSRDKSAAPRTTDPTTAWLAWRRISPASLPSSMSMSYWRALGALASGCCTSGALATNKAARPSVPLLSFVPSVDLLSGSATVRYGSLMRAPVHDRSVDSRSVVADPSLLYIAKACATISNTGPTAAGESVQPWSSGPRNRVCLPMPAKCRRTTGRYQAHSCGSQERMR